MKVIILLFIAWIAISIWLDSVILSAIILFVLIISSIIWKVKTKKKKVVKTYGNDNNELLNKLSGSSCSYLNNQNNKPGRKEEVFFRTDTVNNKKSKPQSETSRFEQNYEVYHRPRDNFCDNMNYMLFKCKGMYVPTGRKRTVTIEAFSESEVKTQLEEKNISEPYEIERIPFPSITDPQKNVIGNISLYDVCRHDASAILSKRIDGDSTSNPQLLSYATQCGIKCSYYTGKKSLYNKIFLSLDGKDKIAFFIFCVYRYATDDRFGNLNESPYKNLFYIFVEENMTNDKFVKSMNQYEGESLRFFGNLTVGEHMISGGSTNTIAYKTAIDFLKKHFKLSNIRQKTI